ncbi:eukaryotic release factor 1 (eRF1) family protein [Artemisia annua]|uniref:Eukaryotic release factor 1 (ERF1) family protein n=1 Tax=Artemisia annua TaxID=35608 RepID=A0A2U1Q4P0_ARTAN|nr:eukaryotic release factor 1 (eRF1) family protein [Artemisia annua]
MKIKGGDYIPDGPGSVEIIPDEPDDLWLAYNLILPGDTVMADTKRLGAPTHCRIDFSNTTNFITETYPT